MPFFTSRRRFMDGNPKVSPGWAILVVALASVVGFSGHPTYGQDTEAATSEASDVSDEASTAVDSTFPLPRPITSFGATRIGEVIYAYGGNIDSPHQYYKGCQSGQLLKLDLAADEPKWEVISEDDQLQGVAMCAHDKYLYRVGGFTALNEKGEDQQLHSLDSFKRFDTQAGKWEVLPALPAGRSSHDAWVMGDLLYVVGGWDMNGDEDTVWHQDTLVCDLSADNLKWETVTPPDFERRAVSMARHGNLLMVAGGMTSDDETTRAVSFYDPDAKAWKEGPELPGEDLHGFGAAAATLGDQAFVSMMDGETYRLNQEGTEWVLVGKSKADRFFHRIIAVNGNLLAIGGTSMESGKFEACDWIVLP